MLLEGDPALREHMEHVLTALGDVFVKWSGSDAQRAAALLRRERADVLFLGASYLSLPLFAPDSDLLRVDPPSIVVVAPDESVALRAFAVRAVDYILSPPDQQRVAEALERGKAFQSARRIPRPEGLSGPETPPVHRLLVRSRGHLSFVRAEDITWVEAQGDYVCLHAGEQKHLVRERISRLWRVLPARLFLRIHRSAIVNIERVREMRHLERGEYVVILHDGTRLTLSRSYRAPVLRRLTAAA
jgi:two-component system LytT family response regulator